MHRNVSVGIQTAAARIRQKSVSAPVVIRNIVTAAAGSAGTAIMQTNKRPESRKRSGRLLK